MELWDTLRRTSWKRPRNRIQLYTDVASKSNEACGLVLDLGAGTGEMSLWARMAFPSSTIVSIDIDAQALKKMHFQYGLSALMGDALRLPFGDECASVVMAEQIIEHLDRARRPDLMSEICRVLRPGGILFFGSVVRERRKLGFLRPTPPDHRAEFRTVEEFTRCLDGAFEPICLLDQPAHLGLARVVPGLLRRLGLGREYDPLAGISLDLGACRSPLVVTERLLPFVVYPGFGLHYVHCAARKKEKGAWQLGQAAKGAAGS